MPLAFLAFFCGRRGHWTAPTKRSRRLWRYAVLSLTWNPTAMVFRPVACTNIWLAISPGKCLSAVCRL